LSTALSESLGVTDSEFDSVNPKNVLLTERLSIIEARTARLHALQAISQTLTAAESILVRFQHKVSFSESAALLETVNKLY
jgi:hypothetical protein